MRDSTACRALAARIGHTVTHTYRDVGRDRSGFRALLEDASLGKIKALIITRPEKIARDLADFSDRMTRLEDAGVTTYIVQDGGPLSAAQAKLLKAIADYELEVNPELQKLD